MNPPRPPPRAAQAPVAPPQQLLPPQLPSAPAGSPPRSPPPIARRPPAPSPAPGVGREEPSTLGPLVVKAVGSCAGAAPLRRVAIINLGGTIGMKANAEGSLEPSPGYLAERLADMAEFQRPEMPATSLYELLPLLDSSDMGPDDWARIARTIEEIYWSFDGFVVRTRGAGIEGRCLCVALTAPPLPVFAGGHGH